MYLSFHDSRNEHPRMVLWERMELASLGLMGAQNRYDSDGNP